MKFYYGEVLKNDFIFEIKRPKKDKKLPAVLSKEEVKEIRKVTFNIKHKAILILMYSGGLQVGEIIRLRSEDIDANGKPNEYTPHLRYNNSKNIPLHEYGRGPFCRFKIPKKYYGKMGVYIILVKGNIKYVGECGDL